MLWRIFGRLVGQTVIVHMRQTLTQHTKIGPTTNELMYQAEVGRVLGLTVAQMLPRCLGQTLTLYTRTPMFHLSDGGPVTDLLERDGSVEGVLVDPNERGTLVGLRSDPLTDGTSTLLWQRASDVLMLSREEPLNIGDESLDDGAGDDRATVELRCQKRKGSGHAYLYVPVSEIAAVAEVGKVALTGGIRTVGRPFEGDGGPEPAVPATGEPVKPS